MAHQPYDRGGKWLIQHHGGSLLKLGGAKRLRSWRAAQAEVVQARQLPDGLLEVEFDREAGAEADPAPGLYVVEIATYPEKRLLEQVARDVASVFLDRGQVPEALTIVLRPHPKWSFQVAGEHELNSPQGWTKWQMSWRVVELWSIPAEQLLAAGDVGMIPWVPLSYIEGPPEPVLRECRARIDAQAPPGERENMLAVTQVLARLRYNDPSVLELFGGRQSMIESPLIQELEAEFTLKATQKAMHESILLFLEGRFGPFPEDVRTAVQRVQDASALRAVTVLAARCPDIDAFRDGLPSAGAGSQWTAATSAGGVRWEKKYD
jgi:hypothetical protein